MPKSVYGAEVNDVLKRAKIPTRHDVAIDGGSVEIVSPFASPEDWRDRWIYFLLVDRFNRPDRPPVHAFDQPFGGFQGGTLEGVRQRLGYLQRLGVGAIWLSPVLQNCAEQHGSYHGYGIQHFLKVDPRFASNQSDPEGEFRNLVDEAHARGMHVILDIVLNHAGDVFAYMRDDGSLVSAADWRGDGYPIRWRDEHGQPLSDWSDAPPANDPRLTEKAAVWPNELRSNQFFRRKGKGGEAGGDFESLKELVTSEPSVRSALIRSYQHAIAKWDVDGFRIDTLKFIERDFALLFGNAMREFALAIGKRNFFTFGEVWDREEKIAAFIGRHADEDGDLVGVDAALDFPLFFKLPGVIKGFAAPTDISAVYDLRRRVEKEIVSSHGEAGRYFVTFLDNHDQHERIRYADPAQPDRCDAQALSALACLFSLQGIPCIYYGTEQALAGRGDSDQCVREALWGMPNAFDENNPFFAAVRDIARVRAENPALRYGRQYFRPVSGDNKTFGPSSFRQGVLAFSRILNDSETVVVANASNAAEIEISVLIDAALNAPGAIFSTLYSSTGAGGDSSVQAIPDATVIGDSISHGTVHALRLKLAPSEARILARA